MYWNAPTARGRDTSNMAKRDSISIGTDFLPLTRQALREKFGDEVDSGLPATWAWIYFRLRAMSDTPETFPHGKWATLQHISGLLDDLLLD